MFSKISFLIFFLFFINKNFAQVNDSFPTSILWEISGNGLKSNSYLLGTIHIRCGDDFILPQTIKQKLKLCTSFYEETNGFEPVGYNQYQDAVKWDKKLDSIIGDTLFNYAAKLFEQKTNIPLKNYNNILPFITTFSLTQKSLGCKKIVSMEKELFQFADKNKIDIYGIETADEHFAVLKDLPDSFQIHYLLWNIFNSDSIAFYSSQIAKSFSNNTFFKIANNNLGNKDYFDKIFDSVMLFKRNLNWIPTMMWRMKIEPTFFAFGASHLIAEKGLVALLKQEGYTLKAVELKTSN